jgi:sorbitol/mannitol transport system substrate-binding protein
MLSRFLLLTLLAATATGCGSPNGKTRLTIATVNNPDMRVMERLSTAFEADNPDLELRWVVLPENELRMRVTSDVAAGSGSFDIVTVGTYEVPLWARNGWIASVDSLMTEFPDLVQPDYDLDDLLDPVRTALTVDGSLHALPFYGESIMTYYNARMFAEAGLSMPERPSWTQIRELACALHKPQEGQYGIVLRGLPGWGESVALLSTVVHTFGGRWFDENWEPQLTSPEWHQAVTFYATLLKDCGQPGPTSTGFTEALTLMSQGRAAIWVDATVAAGFLTNTTESLIAQEVGFAHAPVGTTPHGSHWLWVWSLAIPETSLHKAEALRFITWATSRDYIRHVGESLGWEKVPPGTRTSTYRNPEYLEAAPFAPLVLDAVQTADPTHPSALPVPYVGVQYVGIPEFQGIGTDLSQIFADVLVGNLTVEAALKRASEMTRATMEDAGYYR